MGYIYIYLQVRSVDLADDLVGPSVADTKLRANLFMTENKDWREVKVSEEFSLKIMRKFHIIYIVNNAIFSFLYFWVKSQIFLLE